MSPQDNKWRQCRVSFTMHEMEITQYPTENCFWSAEVRRLIQHAGEPLTKAPPSSASLRQLNELWGLVEQSLPANTALNIYRHSYPSELLALKLYLQVQACAQDALHCLQHSAHSISRLLEVKMGSEQRGMLSITANIDKRACLLHKQAIFSYLGDLLNQLGPEPGRLIADASLPLGTVGLLDAERDTGFNLQPSNQITFRIPADQLMEPQYYRHASLLTHISPALKRFKAEEIDGQHSLEEKVRQKILQSLPEGTAGLEPVAKQLQISSRHLRRKLTEAGTSFETLFESTRKSQADYLIRNTALSLTEIAYELGFNDPSSLTRACKRWFERSPSDYRLQQQASQ
ncbi:MAG: AraC family transcriptional regulator [Pseudomonadaceae bacterium]|nr:MAG: AraC family transcriptional regulator [Pseudomonadaceae bacterium]